MHPKNIIFSIKMPTILTLHALQAEVSNHCCHKLAHSLVGVCFHWYANSLV